MATSTAIRLYTHGPTIAAAAAAAVATAAATADFPERVSVKAKPIIVYSAARISSPGATARSSTTLSASQTDVNSRLSDAEARPCYFEQNHASTPIPPSPSLSLTWQAHLPPHLGYSLSCHQHERIVSRHWASVQSIQSLQSFLMPSHYWLAFNSVLDQSEGQSRVAPSLITSTHKPVPHAFWQIPSGLSGPIPSGALNGPFARVSDTPFISSTSAASISGSPSQRSLHSWHLPLPGSWLSGHRVEGSEAKQGAVAVEEGPATTIVLLGWLGAKQKHMRKYAEWYTKHGIHAVTFVIPMADLVSLQTNLGGKAEEHVEALVEELERWLDLGPGKAGMEARGLLRLGSEKPSADGQRRALMFHTFSNTGWLIYGAVLKRLQERHGKEAVEALIRGCVVDSAPVLEPTPQVWASGFSAAILKKRSIAAAMGRSVHAEAAVAKGEADAEGAMAPPAGPDALEKALLTVLEKFFALFLRMPAVREEVMGHIGEQRARGQAKQGTTFPTASTWLVTSLVRYAGWVWRDLTMIMEKASWARSRGSSPATSPAAPSCTSTVRRTLSSLRRRWSPSWRCRGRAAKWCAPTGWKSRPTWTTSGLSRRSIPHSSRGF